MGLVVGLVMPFSFGYRMYHLAPLTFLKDPIIWVWTMSKLSVNFTTAPPLALALTARRWKALKRQETLNLSPLQLIQLGEEPVNLDYFNFSRLLLLPLAFERIRSHHVTGWRSTW